MRSKSFKRLLSAVLVVMMIISLLPVVAIPAAATESDGREVYNHGDSTPDTSFFTVNFNGDATGQAASFTTSTGEEMSKDNGKATKAGKLANGEQYNIEFTPTAAGKCYIYFSDRGNGGSIKVNGGSPITIANNTASFDTEANTKYTVVRASNNLDVFYIEWVPTVALTDAEAVAAEKTKVETALTGLTVRQADGNSKDELEAFLTGKIGTPGNGVSAEVVVTLNSAAEAGNSSTPAGTNGSFDYTITLTKGTESATVSDTGVAIAATAYVTEEENTYTLNADDFEDYVSGISVKDKVFDGFFTATDSVARQEFKGVDFLELAKSKGGAIEFTLVGSGAEVTAEFVSNSSSSETTADLLKKTDSDAGTITVTDGANAGKAPSGSDPNPTVTYTVSGLSGPTTLKFCTGSGNVLRLYSLTVKALEPEDTCTHATTEDGTGDNAAKAATCTAWGQTAGKVCKNASCGKLVSSPVPTMPTGHTFTAVGETCANCSAECPANFLIITQTGGCTNNGSLTSVVMDSDAGKGYALAWSNGVNGSTISADKSFDDGALSFAGSSTKYKYMKLNSTGMVTFAAPLDGTVTLYAFANDSSKPAKIDVRYTEDVDGTPTAKTITTGAFPADGSKESFSVTGGTVYTLRQSIESGVGQVNLLAIAWEPSSSSADTSTTPAFAVNGDKWTPASATDKNVTFTLAEVPAADTKFTLYKNDGTTPVKGDVTTTSTSLVFALDEVPEAGTYKVVATEDGKDASAPATVTITAYTAPPAPSFQEQTWDFRSENYTATAGTAHEYENANGVKLKLSAGRKHGAQYGLAIGSGTIEVPVTGDCNVVVWPDYSWKFHADIDTSVVEGDKNGTVEADKVVYHFKKAGVNAEKESVVLTIDGNTYIKTIEVKEYTKPDTVMNLDKTETVVQVGETTTATVTATAAYGGTWVGNVSIVSSDEDVATATAAGGVITVTPGSKAGVATLTISGTATAGTDANNAGGQVEVPAKKVTVYTKPASTSEVAADLDLDLKNSTGKTPFYTTAGTQWSGFAHAGNDHGPQAASGGTLTVKVPEDKTATITVHTCKHGTSTAISATVDGQAADNANVSLTTPEESDGKDQGGKLFVLSNAEGTVVITFEGNTYVHTLKVQLADKPVSTTKSVTYEAKYGDAELEGVTGMPEADEVEAGQTVAEPGTDPSKDGYKFLGWFVGNDAAEWPITVNDDTVVTAKFTKKVSFTVPAAGVTVTDITGAVDNSNAAVTSLAASGDVYEATPGTAITFKLNVANTHKLGDVTGASKSGEVYTVTGAVTIAATTKVDLSAATLSISGTAKIGETLTASLTGTGVDAADFDFTWKVGDETTGTTGSTLTVPSGSKGKTITLSAAVKDAKADDYTGTVANATSSAVDGKEIAATVTGYTGAYDGQAHGLTVNVTDPADGAVVKYSLTEGVFTAADATTPITKTDVSTTTVYVEITHPDYETASKSADITINKATWTGTPAVSDSLNGVISYKGGDVVFTVTGVPAGGTMTGSCSVGTSFNLTYDANTQSWKGTNTIAQNESGATHTVTFTYTNGNYNAISVPQHTITQNNSATLTAEAPADLQLGRSDYADYGIAGAIKANDVTLTVTESALLKAWADETKHDALAADPGSFCDHGFLWAKVMFEVPEGFNKNTWKIYFGNTEAAAKGQTTPYDGYDIETSGNKTYFVEWFQIGSVTDGVLTVNASRNAGSLYYRFNNGTENVAISVIKVNVVKVDKTDLTAAKAAVEGATYADINSADATNEAAVKTAVEAIVNAAIASYDGVSATVTKTAYTEAVDGAALDDNGTDGTYKFTVTLHHDNAVADVTTVEKTITIKAAAYAPKDVTITVTKDANVTAVKYKINNGEEQTAGATISAKEGQSVTITAVTFADGYELDAITGVTGTDYPYTVTVTGTAGAVNVTAKATEYTITSAPATNGSFTVKAANAEVTKAAAGTEITVAGTGNSGYEVDAITVTKTGDTATTVTVSNAGVFTMPAYPVTVTVTFKSTTQQGGDELKPLVHFFGPTNATQNAGKENETSMDNRTAHAALVSKVQAAGATVTTGTTAGDFFKGQTNNAVGALNFRNDVPYPADGVDLWMAARLQKDARTVTFAAPGEGTLYLYFLNAVNKAGAVTVNNVEKTVPAGFSVISVETAEGEYTVADTGSYSDGDATPFLFVVEWLPDGTDLCAHTGDKTTVTSAKLDKEQTCADATEPSMGVSHSICTDALCFNVTETVGSAYADHSYVSGTCKWCGAAESSTPGVVKTALTTAITTAQGKVPASANIIDKAEAEVAEGTEYWNTDAVTALNTAITAAQGVASNAGATQEQVDEAVTTLNTAVETFEAAKKTGTKCDMTLDKDSVSVSAGSTATVTATVVGYVGKSVKVISDDATVATATVSDKTITVKGVAEGSTNIYVVMSDTLGAITVDSAKADPSMKMISVTVTKKSTAGSLSGGGGRPADRDETTTPSTPAVTPGTETKPDGTVVKTEVAKDGTVTVTNTATDGSKTETVKKPDGEVDIVATDAQGEVVAEVVIPATTPSVKHKFVDVPDDHWAASAINRMAGMDLVKGVDDVNHVYDMNSAITRGAVATVLFRFSNGKTDLPINFSDVAESDWYADGVAWASKAGVVTGFENGTYQPNESITRQQLAVMIARYAKLVGLDTTAVADLTGFVDGTSVPTWASNGVAWCVKAGIMNGKGNATLDPTAPATRAEAAAMMSRFIDLMK